MAKIVLTDFTFADLTIESEIFARTNEIFRARKEKGQTAELAQLVSGADAVLTQFAAVNAEVIAAMDRAKVIVRYGIGVDNVDLVAARERGIPVCNVPDYCINEVADHTLAFILSGIRQVVPNTLLLRAARWGLATPLESLDALANRTIGVVGFGRIGRAVVRRLRAFDARVLVFDPIVPAIEFAGYGAEAIASLEALLPECDIVTPHGPSNPQTKKLFNAAAFARMKPGAIFINVGRGDLADSAALVAALQSGHLGGAALDVFDPEPIPVDSPLLEMKNVILSAHIASASPQAVRVLRETVAGIAMKAIRGEPLPNIVNGVKSRS
jgi:D-3-phosphoglycerate dehydrogenase